MIQRLHNVGNMNHCQACLVDTLLLHGYLLLDDEVDEMITDSQHEMLRDIVDNIKQLDRRHLYAVFNAVQDVRIAQEMYLRHEPIPFPEVQL